MVFYLYDQEGYYWGTFSTFMDAMEEMEYFETEWSWDGLFITTRENPWG